MLYPVTLQIDAYIQADSYKSAQSIAEEIELNASADFDLLEEMDIVNITVNDVDYYDEEGNDSYDEENDSETDY